eukprot:s2166_g9.t1
MADTAELSLDTLVTLETDVEAYVMDWPVLSPDDGEPEAAVLVVTRRPGGFLAAVPTGFVPEEVLATGNEANPPGLVGPSTVLVVPGMMLEHGNMVPTESPLSVVVVDLEEAVLHQLRAVDSTENYPFSFDPEQPFAFPSPQHLLAAAREWAVAGAESSALPYFSAEEEGEPIADGTLEEEADQPPATPRQRRAKAKQSPAARPKQANGPDRPTSSAKRPTMATLAASIDQLVQLNAGLTETVKNLAERQTTLEQKSVPLMPSAPAPSSVLRQPISTSLAVPQITASAVAKNLSTPPRTQAPAPLGLLSSPQFQPPEIQELETEKRMPDQPISSDPLAQAVLAQSQALTALVSQIAQSSGDPMLELSSGAASASTRGAVGRARLQNELAAQKGVFFNSVLASMARRMQPTVSAEGSAQELLDRGICGTRYLERFGGFARARELGCLQQQVMSILDCLQASNLQAARDQTALLAVAIDQDQGRFELANLLCLQEEPPSTVFSNRQMNVLGKPRAFSPLADQKWVTVALAYIKELDVITTKRLELTSQSRTKLAFCLARSFAAKRRSSETASTVFPLPLPFLDCFEGSGPHLSKRRLWTLARQRLLNVWTLILDFLFLGRWPVLDELRRSPSPAQRSVFDRLWTCLAVCGDARDEFPLCPGRTGPELGAQVFQLESFLDTCPDLVDGYLASDRQRFCPDPGLCPVSKHPELAPYRALDSSRLKLAGEGVWPMEAYLDGPLWLPFQEPSFLLHGLSVPSELAPNFKAEKSEECLKLSRVWDVRGLLFLAESPLKPGYFSRVFNAYKNPEKDRQIGDRRLPNMSEYHVNGPSKHLPQGQQLTMLRIPRYTHCLKNSVTDRRTFYHQAAVSDERARTNMLPFQYPVAEFEDTRAWTYFQEQAKAATGGRETAGDNLKGRVLKKRGLLPDSVFPCFRSLFQGDHLGVEFALRSHEVLLESHGLLQPSSRIQGHKNFPSSSCWDALVIDDYFCLSADPLSQSAQDTFAMHGLDRARQAYETEALLGSPEKDVVSEQCFKAAGAEVRSSEKNVRLGFVPVASPLSKRLALSVLSLRAAVLPGLAAGVCTRLAGNWVSVLQYRKCWSSLIDGLFLFSAKCQTDPSSLFPLDRTVALELVMLAAVAPLISSNVAVDYLPQFFASDASNQKGAIVRAEIKEPLQEALWLDADKKGTYTQLDHPFRALLRQLGEYEHDEPLEFVPGAEGPWKAPLLYFDFVEICGGAGKVADALSEMGFVCAPNLDLSESKHYDLTSLRFMEWLIYMLEEGRFKSFLIEPPCTSFSPAAHPAVRSYREPLGFDRLHPKTLHGNTLAFRSLVLLRVAKRAGRPCGLEQSRLSKMAWLQTWLSLLPQGFREAVIASCRFKSIHRKEFRFLCYRLDVDFLDCRCTGGHPHVKVEGAYTKPSAVYTDGLAHHVALAFRKALRTLSAEELLEPDTAGHETIMANDLMLSSKWEIVRSWFWKRKGHINVLELSSAVSNLVSLSRDVSSCRFCHLVDSAVCRGALSKGRSASRALQPLLKRTCAVCVASDLYPGWIYTPTRLNCADDPTRDSDLRPPLDHSLIQSGFALHKLRKLNLVGLRRFAANWIRLVLLLSVLDLSHGCPLAPPVLCNVCSVNLDLPGASSPWTYAVSANLDLPGAFSSGVSLCDFCIGFLSVLARLRSGFSFVAVFPSLLSPCFDGFVSVWSAAAFSWIHVNAWVVRPSTAVDSPGASLSVSMCVLPDLPDLAVLLCIVLWTFAFSTELAVAMALTLQGSNGMPIVPQTPAEVERAKYRSGNVLVSTRAVRPQTRENRRIYLEQFKKWLWSEKQISFKLLMQSKPLDPERVSDLLIGYGRELYSAGRAYGIYAETINAVVVERPLLRRQLNAAWDMAFVWLQDEPHQHHPALPISVMAAMVSVALAWGWAHEAAIILMGWAGILRIGEVLAATREELILPCDAVPGTTFALLVVRQPKTRGRSAEHQAARIDQEDIIAFLTAMYKDSKPTEPLWPYSAATLRKRFAQLLQELDLPSKKTPGQTVFELGSLRPGGASWMLHATESPQTVQRRGRWASARVMEIYLQEVLVTTFTQKLRPKSRNLIEFYACGFASLLQQSIYFLESGIPCKAWFWLLKAASGLEQSTEKGGHERHVMPDPNKVPDGPEGWKENIDYRLNMMRPNRLKAAYGRGPGWIVTKTGQGHGWDDVGTGRVVDSPLHRKTVDPFDDTPHFSTQSGKKFVSKTKWNPRKSGSQ